MKAPFTCPRARIDEVLGSAAAVSLTVGPAARVLLACSALAAVLAGAALADDEHVGVRAGHGLQEIEHPAHRRRPAQELAQSRLLGQAPLQVGGLRQEPPPLERLVDQGQHLGRIERLGDEVERALLRGLHRLGDGGVPRHDDHFEGRILALELLEELEAIAVGQNEVDQGSANSRPSSGQAKRCAGHPDVLDHLGTIRSHRRSRARVYQEFRLQGFPPSIT